jgi:hypothetical protein
MDKACSSHGSGRERDNIKIDVWEGVEWIYVALNTDIGGTRWEFPDQLSDWRLLT